MLHNNDVDENILEVSVNLVSHYLEVQVLRPLKNILSKEGKLFLEGHLGFYKQCCTDSQIFNHISSSKLSRYSDIPPSCS
ncbi:hypothetical protein Avbf_00207 [Armadillidium vulgare]|nr:hypothetical protein Avbf_00207 [Armadillidium vulgare]